MSYQVSPGQKPVQAPRQASGSQREGHEGKKGQHVGGHVKLKEARALKHVSVLGVLKKHGHVIQTNENILAIRTKEI